MERNHQEDLARIRSMMERSSRFISLSGLSGVVAGTIAIIGCAIAYYIFEKNTIGYLYTEKLAYPKNIVVQLVAIALIVLALAVVSGIYFTVRKSRKNNLPVWNKTTKQLILALSIPLAAGGVFCIALLYHHLFFLVAPATLVFYGLSLVNASKYTFGDIRNLGYCEISLGLISMFAVGYGLLFWATGFGLLHITYGIVMYKKYENYTAQ